MANDREALAALTDADRGKKHLGSCSNCGGTSLKKNDRGNANDGEIPAWNFKCFECGATTIGILIMLPQGTTTLSALDEDYRRKRRMIQRQNRNRRLVARGLTPARTYIPRGNFRRTSDTISITISLHRGATTPGKSFGGGRPSTYRMDIEHPAHEAIASSDELCWHCQSAFARANHLCGACTRALQRARPIRREEAS